MKWLRELLDYWPWLTRRERDCCHMSFAVDDGRRGALRAWRREFRELHETEDCHCRDCPMVQTAGMGDGGSNARD